MKHLACALALLGVGLIEYPSPAQSAQPITLRVDLTNAPRKFLHAEMHIPVRPGPLTLIYPKWIPGEHSPSGPIDEFAGLIFTTNGTRIPWHRDDVDMYAFHLDIPFGASVLDAEADFLATASPTGFSAGASTSPNLCLLSWNELILYPQGVSPEQLLIQPSVVLPEGWKFGTALTAASSNGRAVNFQQVPMNMLIDSPLLAGRFFREVALAPEISPKHFLDIAGDGPEDLALSGSQLAAFSNLIRETGPLYASRHYNSYHFLLTLSDSVAHFGLEHHQSSDDRVSARTFLDDDLALLDGDLLPHEFTHSWNGKYRRPAGLVSADYQQPMKGDLLWVYEGLTQYLGDVLAARSGIWTPDQYLSYLASSAATLSARPGRTSRDLQDTATSAQILYSASDHWDNWRRNVDYYQEGELIWLEADSIIRKQSGRKKSLNDFCVAFLGLNGNTPPVVAPYTFDDLVNALNRVHVFDWPTFFHERLTSLASEAPLGGITASGYRLQFSDAENAYIRATEIRDRGVNAWFSLGLLVNEDDQIDDVLVGSLAYNAGLGPEMHIVAINGRRTTPDLLRTAISESKTSKDPLQLIVENSGFYKVVTIDYHGGERYPHLVREGKGPGLLDDILKPMAKHPESREAE